MLAAGGVIAATVVGSDSAGALTLRTDFGTVALKTLLAIDPGTSVELKLFQGPPVRSHEPFDPAMEAEISTLFHNAFDGSGLSGDVAFVSSAQFPVSPLSTLRPRLGIQI